jgi:hypothetical protein
MTERRHESEDLEDFTVLDSSETLAGPPGDDPLDRGLATPERWSRQTRTGSTAEEQEAGESLDELLAEEEPDVHADDDDDDDVSEPDENAPDYDVQRALLAEGPDARAGRLIIEDGEYAYSDGESVAHDTGVDSGGATAEEAAVHVLGEDAADSDDRQH